MATKKTGTDRLVEKHQPREPLLTDFHKVTLFIYFTLLVLLIAVGSIWISLKILKNLSIIFGLNNLQDKDRSAWDTGFLLAIMLISIACLVISSVVGIICSACCFFEMYEKLAGQVAQPCRLGATSA